MNDYLQVIRGSKVWFDHLATQESDFTWKVQYLLYQILLYISDYCGGFVVFWGGIQKGTYCTLVFLSLQMNRTKVDEEEYWNSSKFKAFTFDDEDDELSQVGFHEQLLKVAPFPSVPLTSLPFVCLVT